MTASEYGQRPSALIGIEDEWTSLDLDMAVWEYGRWVLAHLEETQKSASGKLKPRWTLQQILDGEPLKPKAQPLFALLMASGADGIDI